MNIDINRLSKLFFVYFLLFAFIIPIFTSEADARRRRYYNPKKTREEALTLIQTTSEELSFLCGLEPIINDSIANSLIIDDSELDFGEDEIVEPEDMEIDEDSLDHETFTTLWLSYVDDGEGDEYTESGINKKQLMDEILTWLGTPYRFGGTTRKRIDCSAFIRAVFQSVCEITLPRTARVQVKVGKKIQRNELEFGDMIFFHTYSRRYASHVGIYLGDNLFAHASSRNGVTVSSLNADYYRRRFIGGRRLTVKDLTRFSDHKETDIIGTDE